MAIRPIVALQHSFWQSYDNLPRPTQRKVSKFLELFRKEPTSASINYEKISTFKDPNARTIRIDQAYRGIVLAPDEGNIYVLVWVDHHDKAMDWAKNKRFELNAEGMIQVWDMEVTTAPLKQTESYDGPFAAFTESQLIELGVPKFYVKNVRQIAHRSEFEEVKMGFPEDVREVLSYLIDGVPYDEVLETITLPDEVNAPITDLATALSHPKNHRQFMVLTDENETELQAMLDEPLALWRVFLHPSQRKLAYHPGYNGSTRLLGGAGTGKTVVAMHRAKYLAQKVFTSPEDKILVTTFTKNLAADIKQNLASLCDKETFKRFDIINLDALAFRLASEEGLIPANTHPVDKRDLERIWGEVCIRTKTPFSSRFCQEEWEYVVQHHGCETLPEYIAAKRSGRGKRLGRVEKARLWKVFEAFQQRMSLDNQWENFSLNRTLRKHLDASGKRPYRAVVVDESQDFRAEDLKLLRALVEVGPNDMFLVGDPHQRIYGVPVVLSQCGINVLGGRSRRLKLNYRTTEEIRYEAVKVLEGQNFDDMDGGSDSLQGYVSLMNGERPEVRQFDSKRDELEFLIDFLSDPPCDPEEICLVTRARWLYDKEYVPALEKAGIPFHILDGKETDHPGIRIATMHRVKGLEFACIIIAGATDDMLPRRPKAEDPLTREYQLLQERSLLYVAMTRAKKSLLITAPGQLSTLFSPVSKGSAGSA